MYGNPYNQQLYMQDLQNMKDRIDKQMQQMNQPSQTGQPVNNIINTTQTEIPKNNLVEWRILNENEQVDNLYVNNKTLFINDNIMVLKGVDGSLEKWDIKKVYPIDKKDQRINELETKLKEMEEKLNEYTKLDESINGKLKSNGNDNGNDESKSKDESRSITKKA